LSGFSTREDRIPIRPKVLSNATNRAFDFLLSIGIPAAAKSISTSLNEL